MAAITVGTLSKAELFPKELIPTLFSKVKGHSAIANLSGQTPIAFNGNEQFVFDMPNEIDIVAENGAKSHGGASVSPVNIVPIKFEYGARISDEFMYASEEEQINTLTEFANGFARKVARGLDLAAFHGVNPRTGTASTVVGDNHFDNKVSQTITYTASTADDNLESAIATIQATEGDINGFALSPAFGAAMAAIKANGIPQYPEFKFGQKPSSFAGIGVDINKTVSDISYTSNSNTLTDMAIVGDFANAFRWGYAKNIPMEIIQYGNPDNSENGDLKGHNQIYIRSEVYLGWGIIDPTAFARIVKTES